MGRGFIFGAIWGVVLSGFVLAALSLSLPLPGEAPVEPVAAAVEEDDAPEAIGVAAPSASDDTLPTTDTASAAVPEVSGVETGLVAPSLPDTVDAPEADSVSAVTVSPDVVQPAMPDIEGSAVIATDPVQPLVPSVDLDAPVVALEGDGPSLTTPSDGAADTGTDMAAVPETDMADEDAEQPAPTGGDLTPSSEAGEAALSDDPPLPPPLALETYAVPFVNIEQRPIVSIVLMDGGASPFPSDLLGDLPVPVSFAVEAGSPSAKERMAQYRAAGYEVLVIPAVSPEATLEEMDAALDAALVDVPESVAFLDPFENGYTQRRALAEPGIARLSETGHGLLHLLGDETNPDLIALRAGVPSLTVFRDFDAEGESSRVITRFLDQAAFKARQQGVVVMLGRTRPETFAAITVWAQRSRATSVAIAPISAAFRAETGG